MSKIRSNRRKTKKRNVSKGFNEQLNYRNEAVRLKRKIKTYLKQELALMKILDVVCDQMTRIEVEGLQMAAIKRQEDEKELNDDIKLDNTVKLPKTPRYFENIDEINNSELKLGGSLDELFIESHAYETEEDEDPLDLLLDIQG